MTTNANKCSICGEPAIPNVRTIGGGGLCQYHCDLQRRGKKFADAERETAQKEAERQAEETRRQQRQNERERKQKANAQNWNEKEPKQEKESRFRESRKG